MTASCYVRVALANVAAVGLLRGTSATAIQMPYIIDVDEDEIPDFDSFLETEGRDYERGSQDYQHRRGLYEDRRSWARKHNTKPGRLWTAGVSQHWDWREEELDDLHGGPASVKVSTPVALVEQKAVESHADMQARLRATAAARKRIRSMPKSVSWAHLNSTRKIEDQGKCGSCWAVTAASLLSMHHEIYRGAEHGELKSFSAQDLVDCVPNEKQCGGTGGCHGATVELALDWAWKRGAKSDSQVPYHAKAGACQEAQAAANGYSSLMEDRTTPGSAKDLASVNAGEAFGLAGWQKLTENAYEPLVKAVYEKGPVGVSVHARGWHFYKNGIFDECQRDVVLGHAVTLLGYGETKTTADSDTTKYWHIQNSWGPRWGENGRIRLLRTDDDQEYCGIDNEPGKGTGCKGGPPEVTVCGTCGVLYDSALPNFRGGKINGALVEW